MQPASEPAAGEVERDARPGRARRLHPLTPLVSGVRIVGALAAFAVLEMADLLAHPHSPGRGTGGLTSTLVETGVLAAAMVAVATIRWAVTRFSLVGGELHVDSGLLRRRSKRLRLDRVQSVDILEPLSARLFGLAELKIGTAGSGRGTVRLAYLSKSDAHTLRSELLDHAGGTPAATAGPTPESSTEGAATAGAPPGSPLVVISAGHLVAAVALRTVGWRSVPVLVGPAVAVAMVIAGATTQSAVAVGVGIFVPIGFELVHSTWKQLSGWWGFTVTETADGLQIRSGLLSTSTQAIPRGRIQAIRIHQPLLWRPLDWAVLEVNVAGLGERRQRHQAVLLPVARRPFAEWLVARVLEIPDLRTVPVTVPPRRARYVAPWWWRAQAAGADDRIFVSRHGRLSRSIDVLRHERTQSVRLSAGPVQRCLHLATVHLDSPRGPVRVRASHRSATEARAILDEQVDRARAARGRLRHARRCPQGHLGQAPGRSIQGLAPPAGR